MVRHRRRIHFVAVWLLEVHSTDRVRDAATAQR